MATSNFALIGVVIVHLGLHLAASSSVASVDKDRAHTETRRVLPHHRHAAHLLLLHAAQALHLDQILHVLAGLLKLSLQLLHRRWLLDLLLHLELHVVEDAIEIHWVQLHRHFHCRVLLEVHEWLLPWLGVHHSSGSLNPLALLHSDLLPIEDHQLYQTLDHDHAVVLFSSNRVMNEGKVE